MAGLFLAAAVALALRCPQLGERGGHYQAGSQCSRLRWLECEIDRTILGRSDTLAARIALRERRSVLAG